MSDIIALTGPERRAVGLALAVGVSLYYGGEDAAAISAEALFLFRKMDESLLYKVVDFLEATMSSAPEEPSPAPGSGIPS